MTISIQKAVELVRQYKDDSIDAAGVGNIHMLMEIRDNAVHLSNIGKGLGRRVQEVGTASLKNYVHAIQKWFNYDLSRYNFYLMPLAFYGGELMESLLIERRNPAARRLLDYIAATEREYPEDQNREYSVTLRIDMKFIRTKATSAIPVQVTTDPNAIKVQLSEEDFRQRYPWDYEALRKKMQQRYSNFIQNQAFYAFKAAVEKDPKFCRVRYLDPNKPKGTKKKFYNPNILAKFDILYARRDMASAAS